MGKQVTWLGDEDPSVQVIEQYGHRFVKGEPVAFHGDTTKLEGNPFFSVGKKADPIESDAPPAVDPDQGTETAAIKRQLDARSVAYKSDATLDTLRGALAKAEADAAKAK